MSITANHEESNIFDNLITTEQVLNQQGLELPASTNSTEVLYKQLWSTN